MKKLKKGFLLITAAVIIVTMGILSVMLASLAIRSNAAARYLDAIQKADSIAESGIEQGVKNLTQSTISSRQTCAALSNTTALTTGSFTVNAASDAANSVNPLYTSTTLTTALTTTNPLTSIVVASTSGLSSHGGRILIDKEVFRYRYISNATTLNGISRGQDGTLVTSHPTGSIVSMYQCTMSSTGSAPTTSPQGIRQYQAAVQQPIVIVAGATSLIARWNNSAGELIWNTMTSPSTLQINSLSAINYHVAWGVTNQAAAGSSRFIRLNGTAFAFDSATDPSPNNANLLGVSTVSEQEVWAVGPQFGGSLYAIYRRFNGTWCRLTTTTSGCGGKFYNSSETYSGQQDLSAVEVLDTTGDGFGDFGFAVGGITSGANRSHILYYNGTNWVKYAQVGTAQVLNGVKITPKSTTPTEAWAAGSSTTSPQGVILKWTGPIVGTWAIVAATTTVMNAIDVIDTNNDGIADFGVAVGVGGNIYTYNGTTWSGPTNINANNLNKVKILSTTDIWVAGNTGVRMHYDGTSWVALTTGVGTSANFLAMDAIFPRNSPLSSWYDVVN